MSAHHKIFAMWKGVQNNMWQQKICIPLSYILKKLIYACAQCCGDLVVKMGDGDTLHSLLHTRGRHKSGQISISYDIINLTFCGRI
jgi:hypothetical protein